MPILTYLGQERPNRGQNAKKNFVRFSLFLPLGQYGPEGYCYHSCPEAGGFEMVLVNISSLTGPISLKMHILIVSNESRLKRDDFRGFKKYSGFFWARQSHFETEYTNFHDFVQT